MAPAFQSAINIMRRVLEFKRLHSQEGNSTVSIGYGRGSAKTLIVDQVRKEPRNRPQAIDAMQKYLQAEDNPSPIQRL
jgi:hypothetical protein